jgi:hypothetical protein
MGESFFFDFQNFKVSHLEIMGGALRGMRHASETNANELCSAKMALGLEWQEENVMQIFCGLSILFKLLE